MVKYNEEYLKKVVKAIRKSKTKFITSEECASVIGLSLGRGRVAAQSFVKAKKIKVLKRSMLKGGLENVYYLKEDEAAVKSAVSVSADLKSNKYTEEDFEYESQVQRLKDEKSTLSTKLTKIKREESLFSEIRKQIEINAPKLQMYKPFSKKKPSKSKITETALLCLGDVHADQIVYPERVDNLEKIDFNVMCRRAEKFVDTTISHLRDNMTNYNFENLVIAGLGEYVSGEIHGLTHHSAWCNAIKNAQAVGELISFMLVDLLAHFKHINFVTIQGNHGRRTTRKDFKLPTDHWDYLVISHVYAKLRNYIDAGRLNITYPNAWSATINIYDWNFCINHGDNIQSYQGIPYYGIERKTRRLTALGVATGVIPHYFLYGHFHRFSSFQHPVGEVIINGSWGATDEFIKEACGGFSEPFQLLAGVHPKYGLTWRLPIKLRRDDWFVEEDKPSRYKVDLFDKLESI